MRIFYYSDLHLEFFYKPEQLIDVIKLQNDPEELKESICILAGDISVGTKTILAVQKFSEIFKEVIYIPGNHEFYMSNMQDLLGEFELTFSCIKNVHFLHNDYVIINDTVFFGSTFWSDLNNGDEFYCKFVMSEMNDFDLIKVYKDREHTSSKKISPRDCVRYFNDAITSLKKALRENPKNNFVIISHFCPFEDSVSEHETKRNLENYYSYNFTDHISSPNIKTIVHGHSHITNNYEKDGIRVLSNPYGYFGESLNKDFNFSASFDI